MASHASPNIFSIQSSLRLSAARESPQVGHSFNRASRREMCWTVATKVAWLQVSGDTERGAPVTGWTCYANTPEGSACPATQSRMSNASPISASLPARATR